MRGPAQRRAVQSKSIPAPVGGWNKRDSIADMASDDAVIMDNMFPLPSEVMLRKGYTEHVTGVSGTVNTLAAYNSPTINRLFGAAGTSIYNVTSAGAVGAAVVTGQTSDKWQKINFSNSGGNYMYLANGADSMQLYDGTNWQAVTAVSSPIAITGVTTSTIIGLNIFKNRIWMVQKDTMKVWYLATDAIGGAATALDLAPLFKNGGYLMAMGTWSLDAGQGLDDYAVFVTSQGEVAVYKGTDPASASTFALVGVFLIGSPIGRRCFEKFGGDLIMVSRDGLLPMSKALMSSRVNQQIALTDKIQQAAAEVATLYASNFGWETILYPSENMLLMNIPVSSTESQQYVMNTITGAWCRFTGWQAACWERFNDMIYFGTASGVNLAWSGLSDNAANIDGEVLQAFSYFGNTAQVKRFTLIQPIFRTNGSPGITIGINVDFDTSAPVSTPTFSATSAAVWDVALWDTGIWGGSLEIKKDWIGVTGVGRAASAHLKVALLGIELRWAATVYNYETGGFL